MDIIVSTLEQAVVNAVNLLTRSRMKRNGPFYLLKPLDQLMVRIQELSTDDNEATVEISCGSWASTRLTLTLGKHNGIWFPWGTFRIIYTNDYPVSPDAIRAGTVSTAMYPMYVHRPSAARAFELRIRSCHRPGR